MWNNFKVDDFGENKSDVWVLIIYGPILC